MKTTPEKALRELLKASKATAKSIKALEKKATRPKPKKRRRPAK